MSEKGTAVRKSEEQADGDNSSVSCPQNFLCNTGEPSTKRLLEDEIIYSASYSKLKAVMCLFIMMPLPLYLVIGVAHSTLIDKKYISSMLFTLIFISFIIIIIDSLLFKELVFYSSSVTKKWHLFGKRTIHYSVSKIVGPPSGLKWLSSAYHIRELDKNGKTILKQVPIVFIAFFFSAKDSKSIENIFNYLTDFSNENPRMIVKNRLHKGDL